jgi:hypothetical protein
MKLCSWPLLITTPFHFKVAQANRSPLMGKLVGGVSLARWISVVFGGLFIAFTLGASIMSLLSVFQWLPQTDFATALRKSALVYPTVMATHLTGMALFGGMIFITDLRILGIAMRGTSVSGAARDHLRSNVSWAYRLEGPSVRSGRPTPLSRSVG